VKYFIKFVDPGEIEIVYDMQKIKLKAFKKYSTVKKTFNVVWLKSIYTYNPSSGTMSRNLIRYLATTIEVIYSL